MANVQNFVKSFNTGYINIFKQKALTAINEVTQARLEKLKEFSPIDTGEYINSHKIQSATINGDRITGGNYNDADDAYGVEFGFRKTPVNRHKKTSPNQPYSQRQVIYNGVGANVYQRVSADTKLVEDIYKKIL